MSKFIVGSSGAMLLAIMVACASCGWVRGSDPDARRNPTRQYYQTFRYGATYAEPIQDPLQWSADNYAERPGPDASVEKARLHTQDLDLDHDGTPELLVRSHWHTWQACAAYLAFKRSAQGYRYMGRLYLMVYKVMPLAADGTLRLADYQRSGPGGGQLRILSHDGERFIPLSAEDLYMGEPGDETPGKKRFRELFRENAFQWGKPRVLHID